MHESDHAGAGRCSGELYALAFKSSSAAMAITRGRRELYVDVNDAFVETTGLARDRVIGRPEAEVKLWAEPTEREALVEEVLRRSEAKFAKAFRNSVAAMTITDLGSGRYVDVNDAWARIFGLAPRDAIGKTSLELGVWKDAQDREGFIGTLLQHGLVRDAEFDFRRADGQEWRGLVSAQMDEIDGRVVVLSSVTDVTESARAREELARSNRKITYGRVAVTGESVRFESEAAALGRHYDVNAFRVGSPEQRRVAVLFNDVSERKRYEQVLRRANEGLAEADRRKSEFLAVLSHELRNPLAPIRNSVYILEHAAPGGEHAVRAREVIERQVQHLAHLVDDLLEVTRITQGKVRLRRELLDFAELVRRCAEDHRPLFTGAGIDFDVETPEAAVFVKGDPGRLAQVIGNLLTNAAKFTPEGGRTTLRVEATSDHVQMRVRDSGAGMAPDLLQRLFEPFVQADRTLERTQGGLGLGLAILKGLVELHGGSVAAHSEGPGQGAEFVVALPVAEAPPERQRVASRQGPRNRRTVLVIEDSDDAAESLKTVLELHGHEVAVARDGLEGLELARRTKPDVVLCGIGLPGMDGYAVGRALRADRDTSGTRLIAVSGYAQPEDVKESQAAGFDDHWGKPVDPGKLADL